jgi:hypothetical protein
MLGSVWLGHNLRCIWALLGHGIRKLFISLLSVCVCMYLNAAEGFAIMEGISATDKGYWYCLLAVMNTGSGTFTACACRNILPHLRCLFVCYLCLV